MEDKRGKSNKIYKSITDIVKVTFTRGTNHSNQCKYKDEPEDSRSRSQGIFRTFRKKLKQNKFCKSKKVTAVEPVPLQIGYMQEDPTIETAPPVPPRAPLTINDLNENQYLSVGDLNMRPSDCSSPSKSSNTSNNSIGREHFNLAQYGWYWGPITKNEAQNILSSLPDGSFLVRDSSSDRHVFTLSFRSFGQTMHSHIDYNKGVYSMGDELDKSSVAELIETAVHMSKNSIFSYSRSRTPTEPAYPVRLTAPVTRFNEVKPLLYLCRFVIRQYVNVNKIQDLPIPKALKEYLKQGQY